MQKVYKTYKYKLKPNTTQRNAFERYLGVCRFLYNSALEHRIVTYQSNGASVSAYEQMKELPSIKKDLPWIGDIYSQVLQNVILRVDKSFKRFFNGFGFPKFKKKKFYNSFTFPQNVVVNTRTIKLPKIGEVKYYNSRPIQGKIKTTTIIRQLDGWYIAITTELEPISIVADDSQAVGIDVGIAKFAYLSDGSYIESPYFLEPNLKRLRILQRKLSRQKKGSKSRVKTVMKIRKLHLKIKRQRIDFLHKVSTSIANKYSSCYVEDLKLQNMTKLNSTLSRRMLDNGFYTFRLFLEYKFIHKSNHFSAIPPAYTSQTCSGCGEVNKLSRVSQDKYICTSCGLEVNADYNAALNIKAKGISFRTQRKAVA